MNIYFQHYWSLFIDFIEDFKEVEYKGIPLPLLSTFQIYIDDKLNYQMKDQSFSKILRNKIQNEYQIQPSFDYYLNSIGNKSKSCDLNKGLGKIVIHEGDLLRFPNEYLRNFEKKKTILLVSTEVRKKKIQNHLKNLRGITSVDLLSNYRSNVRELEKTLVTKAQSIFSKYNSHPVYSNINFSNKFIEDIPKMISLLAAYENYFDKVSISGVVVGNTSGMYSRILTIIARSKGIPSICTQHGIIGNELGYLPIFASIHAVFGHYEKKWYRKQGVEESCLEITGHPRFDCIYTNQRMPKKDFIKELGIDHKKKLVFVPTNMTRDIKAIDEFIKLLIKNPEITVIIKAHPSEIIRLGVKAYERLSLVTNSVKLVKTIDLYDILVNVDLVVQELSTVGLEAMLFEKPVFFLHKQSYFETNDRYYYEGMSEFSHYNPAILKDMINDFFTNQQMQIKYKKIRKEFLDDAYPQLLSGQKIGDLIYKTTGVKVYSQ
ncbi:CDP-glycerol glycerophosphotransferase family protein [Metabacillus litoralis]|uniref:CDP-glycerol glycerophosphotransferase family protein n=1 Tax=Metabacillus litoralis TaxID=152268 RepID=UPI00203BCE45|nr:CDP-glycerol glycerophosphotransferase family protein [Metabacillus litoralis]MCM3654514.1 CDP-glycerol glycerophosphotransferase family protein [Metabacillus litoralis]